MLEDLSIEYFKPPRVVGWLAGLRGVAGIHTELGHAADRHGTSDLLRYDSRFREGLMEFGHRAISRFHLSTGERAASHLIDQWADLQRAYLSPRFEVTEPIRPIHGDLNTGNVFVSREPGRSLKAVDWEWAGIGLPHVDYASFVKRAPTAVFDSAVQELVTSYPDLPKVEHETLLRHGLLERCVWDAALLAEQAQIDGRFERLTPGVRRSLEEAAALLPDVVAAT
jgi:thiamine kinase-like enzyme